MRTRLLAILVLVLAPALVGAQVDATLRARVQQEKQPLLDTLRDLVSIESGSSDVEGLARIGALIAGRLRALGGEVEMVPPAANMPRFSSTPPALGDTIVARFRGRGTRRVLLLAHSEPCISAACSRSSHSALTAIARTDWGSPTTSMAWR
jgi:glutamate carboxypeptidase